VFVMTMMMNLYCLHKDELQTTARSYEGQLSMMSEHLAAMNERLTQQKDEIDILKYQLEQQQQQQHGSKVFSAFTKFILNCKVSFIEFILDSWQFSELLPCIPNSMAFDGLNFTVYR